MSVTLMAQVFPLELSSTEKLVLLALADSANDEDAQTWIPIRRKRMGQAIRADGRKKLDLTTKTSLGVRAIQFALRSLEAAGHLSRVELPGKGVIYTIHPLAAGSGHSVEERKADQAAGGESSASPRGESDSGVNLMTPRGESDSPKPEVTIKSLSREEGARIAAMITVETLGGRTPGPDAKEDTRATLAVEPSFWSAWTDFLAMRRKKGKPMNAQAAETLFRALVRLAREGHDPTEVVEQSIANHWTGFWPVKDEAHERHHHHRADHPGPGVFGNPMVGAALRAAGAGADPGRDTGH